MGSFYFGENKITDVCVCECVCVGGDGVVVSCSMVMYGARMGKHIEKHPVSISLLNSYMNRPTAYSF